MKYRELGKNKDKVSVLGFGAMRLPLIDEDPGNIDEEESIKLLRYAIDNGISYIDTAYNYHKGKSEIIVGKALKDGYRDKTKIATKLPVWLTNAYEDFDKYLNEQLQKLDVEYIDFYLLHNLNKKYWEKLTKIDIFKFLDRALADGRIKNVGFSFHDELSLFKEIIDSYSWDFCQIQYNYMNENYQAGKEGLKYAASKGIPVIIMEPLLGGKLAKEPPVDVKALWDKADIKRTPAEWGLRWIYNHPEVSVILSGMSNFEQLKENLRIADAAIPETLTEKELELVKEVERKYRERVKIDCTECGYCMPCPNNVSIPSNFELYNDYHVYDNVEAATKMYKRFKQANQSADLCVECGKCEAACPQHLPISKLLKEVEGVLHR
jgi:predicted aldo/keto reductase-like oxidoreductase